MEKLGTNIKGLKKTLQPIHNAINLSQTWWDKIETIADKLMDTFNGIPDKDWWSKIVTMRAFGSGARELKGWFMVDLLNISDANYTPSHRLSNKGLFQYKTTSFCFFTESH